MIWIRILLITLAIFFGSRTFFRVFGQKNESVDQKFDIFCSMILSFCTFFATQTKFFVILGIVETIFLFPRVFQRQKNKKNNTITDFLDQILMTMSAGMSFESALKNVSRSDHQWEKWISFAKMSQLPQTNDQEKEIIETLRACSAKPTQTYKIMSSLRQSLRLRARLQEKQAAITLQSRAQAIVSILLYAMVVGAQLFLQKDFLTFLKAALGKITLIISLCLVGGGVKWVFWLSVPKELEL
jgi:Flp pilus assembly protein TadB